MTVRYEYDHANWDYMLLPVPDCECITCHNALRKKFPVCYRDDDGNVTRIEFR